MTGSRYTPYCEDILEIFGVDVRYIYPNSQGKGLFEAQKNHREFITKWGSKIDFKDSDGEKVILELDPPLSNATMKDLEDYLWPKPDQGLTDGLRKKAQDLKDKDIYAIAVYRPLTAGIWNTVKLFLRGTVKFFEDMLLDKNLSHAFLSKTCEVHKSYYKSILDEIGDLIDIIEIEDDMGMQDRLQISPSLYRELVKPYHSELVNSIKSISPHVKVLMHCDGAISEIIKDLIEIGIDILNPIQVNCAGMDLKNLKKRFGKDITFAGAVDVQKPMSGEVSDVQKCVEETIKILAPGGGFLLGPSHNFSPNILIKNIIEMFEYAKKFNLNDL